MAARVTERLWDIGDIVKLVEEWKRMAEAIERLVVLSFFGALAAWAILDIRRHLRDGEYRSWRSWGVPSGVAVRGRDPFTYWGAIVAKAVGAVAALVMAGVYLYLSLTH
jgi:hypothetical protein